jgi:hypothetical protein
MATDAPANQSDTLKALIPNEYRAVMSLAKAALSIVLIIIDENHERNVESLHTILGELQEWQMKATAALIGKTCFVHDPNRREFTDALKKDYNEFTNALNPIDVKAKLHKREYHDRIQGNPRAVNIPADYDPKETLIEIMNLLTNFQSKFDGII